jgi:hypothetical protein
MRLVCLPDSLSDSMMRTDNDQTLSNLQAICLHGARTLNITGLGRLVAQSNVKFFDSQDAMLVPGQNVWQ